MRAAQCSISSRQARTSSSFDSFGAIAPTTRPRSSSESLGERDYLADDSSARETPRPPGRVTPRFSSRFTMSTQSRNVGLAPK